MSYTESIICCFILLFSLINWTGFVGSVHFQRKCTLAMNPVQVVLSKYTSFLGIVYSIRKRISRIIQFLISQAMVGKKSVRKVSFLDFEERRCTLSS